MKKSNKDRAEKEGGKQKGCAEAAELQSGLVASAIILMLVVKLLWARGKPLC